MLWAIGLIVLLAIAGGGGYAWYQHVEETRVAEEKAAVEAAKQAEERRRAQPKAAPVRRVAASAPESEPRAGPKGLQQELAAACGSIAQGLKKTWCEEQARDRYCGANPRAAECR